jgi:hypothetical protein
VLEEVAEIIHLPRNTVKARMFYARKRLAPLTSTHPDFDHSWSLKRPKLRAPGARP